MDCSSTAALAIFAMALVLVTAHFAGASTYVVFLPLDSPIYDELDTRTCALDFCPELPVSRRCSD